MNQTGRQVFEDQARELLKIGGRLGAEFGQAVNLMFNTRGRVIISGMGKSGIIGRKMAATLSSTGTSAFFVHPGEAYHGDLGMFKGIDTAILISYSGETEEAIRLIPSLRHFGMPIIAIVGRTDSTLGRHADVVLDVSVEREVCPNNLAPTTSTTATLVMGDALAVALINKRDFKPQDFARYHPGGSLGRRLLTRVRDVMHKNVPHVSALSAIVDVIESMTHGGLGLAVVHASEDPSQVVGVITDGDLRRALLAQKNIYQMHAAEIMSTQPKQIKDSEMFAAAEQAMLAWNITALLAVDETGAVSGVLKLLDIKKV